MGAFLLRYRPGMVCCVRQTLRRGRMRKMHAQLTRIVVRSLERAGCSCKERVRGVRALYAVVQSACVENLKFSSVTETS